MTTTAQIGANGATISESDANGVRDVRLRVLWDAAYHNKGGEAVRLIVIACNLEGGIERAIELIRDHAVRQKEAS